MAKINNYILVCGGTGCRASRSEEIIAAQHFFGQALLAHGGNHLSFGGNGSMVGAGTHKAA